MESTEQLTEQLNDINTKLDDSLSNDHFNQEQLNMINDNVLLINDNVQIIRKYIDKQETKEETESVTPEADSKAASGETTEEILVQIRDNIDTGNKITAINGLFISIVIGLLFIKILVDNIRDN